MPEGVRKGTLYTLIGFGASGVLQFLFNMIAARSLGPAGFGVLNVLYSLITTIAPFVGGISTGVIRFVSAFEAKGEKERIQGTIRNGFILWICFFFLILIMTLIVKDSIKAKYLDNSFFLLLVFILGTLFSSLFTLVGAILRGLRELKYNAITVIIQYLFMVLFLLVFVLLLNLGVEGASIAFFSAPLISLIVVILICFALKDRFMGNISKGSLSRFFSFAGPVTLSGFLIAFLLRCGPLLIKTLGGIDANKLAGLFASVFALVSVGRMSVSALGIALFPNLSRADALGDTELQKRYIKKSILFISGLCLLMIIGFWWFGPIIMKIVYGKEFAMRRLDILLIATMGGLYFLALLFNGILLAKSLIKEALISWGSAVAFLILFIWLTKVEILLRVEVGLCLANFIAFILMITVLKYRVFTKIE